MEFYDMKTYGEVQVCERNGSVHTYGNNINFPGCGGCHCCSEHGKCVYVHHTYLYFNKKRTWSYS